MNSNISDLKITIRDLVKDYKNSDEDGVYGYDGKLTIRPAFQREFVYKDKQRDAVIDSVMKGYPIGIMYWSLDKDGNYECLDGQQRTMSICEFVSNKFSVNINGHPKIFNNLTEDEKNQILNYELLIYGFTGTDSEKLEWFKRINTPGVPINNQELLNAVYVGDWVTDAKRYFSKRGCPAVDKGKGYVDGKVDRQEYLEKVLSWAADKDNLKDIDVYMSRHQNDKDANELWQYYQDVINWADKLFPEVDRRLTIKQEWGYLYNKYKLRLNKEYNTNKLKEYIDKLVEDGEVTNQSGIIPYVLSDKTPSDEKYLSIRAFSIGDKRRKYNEQTRDANINKLSNCPFCAKAGIKKIYLFDEMQGDHIVPWSLGGKTSIENLQMLCRRCNNTKRDK